MTWRRGVATLSGVLSVAVLLCSQFAYAQTSSSPTYSVDQVFFGAGGELNACSASNTYCAKQSAGEIAAGNLAGNAFRANAGFNVDRSPYLAFSVNATNTDLGTLGTAGTATTTASFAVKTYLANGYVVVLASDPPKSNGVSHTLNALTTPTASSAGTEQFGANLVQNTTGCANHAPANFGADPVQVPDNTFAFGTVAPDYATCGLFKYVKDDTIAQSTRSTGETDYTMSFIYNISPVTPDGQYTYNGTLVAISTY